MNYELKVTELNSKANKFHYQVIDQDGKIISERKSNRKYVACTTDGAFYFGRIDLIGKGDHGRRLKWSALSTDPKHKALYESAQKIAYLKNNHL